MVIATTVTGCTVDPSTCATVYATHIAAHIAAPCTPSRPEPLTGKAPKREKPVGKRGHAHKFGGVGRNHWQK